MKEKFRKEKGITLIALVITIIVLLILAGVSIAMLTGENGILTQAQRAKTETENAQAEEKNILANYESYLNSYSGENTEFTDSLGNKVVVPAGFRVVNPEDNVEDGIIIEDVAHGTTAGSQFVWIPVGKGIKKKDGTIFDVTLGRYVFKEDGTIDTELSTLEPDEHLKTDLNSTNYFIEEIKDSETENIHAKDIEDFILKANTTGGYYIGRYEARTSEQRLNKDKNLTPIILKGDGYIYNYITIIQASELSRNMYKNNNFESDLMNSYAWDTAIDFLQKNDNRLEKNKVFSRQTSLNTETVAEKGTNNLEIVDKICNVFDMASNCREWTTEIYTVGPYAARGGCYAQNSHYTSSRVSMGSSFNSTESISFRPILYL